MSSNQIFFQNVSSARGAKQTTALNVLGLYCKVYTRPVIVLVTNVCASDLNDLNSALLLHT